MKYMLQLLLASLLLVGCSEKKSPLELFEEFYEKQNNQSMTEEQRRLSQEFIEAVWRG